MTARHDSPRREAWRRFRRDRAAVLGLGIVVTLLAVAALAPLLAPYDPDAQSLLLPRQQPSHAHLLGTDELGRDVLSRLLYGAGGTIAASTFAVAVGGLLGTPLGLVAGYFGGRVDAVAMRLVDAMLAFPAFLLAIVVVAILGPSLENAALAIGVAQIPMYARVVRGSVLVVRGHEYVTAALSVGVDTGRVIFRHVWPNVLSPVIVLGAVALANAILSIAGLSFLGLGAQPPSAEWGVMLGTGRQYIRDAPHLTIVPGLAIMLLVLAVNLMGDGLRDALDPRTRRV